MNKKSHFWSGRTVLVTGHTGFKGGWLTVWLEMLGAKVHGFSLDPPEPPTLFECAEVEKLLESDHRADLLDRLSLEETIEAVRPEIVFHLAAQPLVEVGFRDPAETWRVNVLGTVNVLEAVLRRDEEIAVVVVTTDKVYEDQGAGSRYGELDALGGGDPYSASKASVELVTRSFMSVSQARNSSGSMRVATARSGNVIGGGDWSKYRLLPDCLRAFALGEPVTLRMPDAVRPWQHVLEPLGGYLRLAEELCGSSGGRFASAWNFGPNANSELTVQELADAVAACWGPPASVKSELTTLEAAETHSLRLDSAKASRYLGWRPRWGVHDAVERTVAWHKEWLTGGQLLDLCREQISAFLKEGP